MSQENFYPPATREMSEKRASLAPEITEAFRGFSKAVFKEGALPEKTKQLIAIAVAHVTQCPYCIRGHTAGSLGAPAGTAIRSAGLHLPARCPVAAKSGP